MCGIFGGFSLTNMGQPVDPDTLELMAHTMRHRARPITNEERSQWESVWRLIT